MIYPNYRLLLKNTWNLLLSLPGFKKETLKNSSHKSEKTCINVCVPKFCCINLSYKKCMYQKSLSLLLIQLLLKIVLYLIWKERMKLIFNHQL